MSASFLLHIYANSQEPRRFRTGFSQISSVWEKVLRYYLKRKKAGKAFLWGPILDLKKYGENNGESGFCGVGLIQIYKGGWENLWLCGKFRR